MTSPDPAATNLEGNAILQNEQGDVVAIVTDIINNTQPKEAANTNSNQQHFLSTDSNQNAAIIPPLIPDTDKTETEVDNIIKSEIETDSKPKENQVPSLALDSNQNADANAKIASNIDPNSNNSAVIPETVADANTNNTNTNSSTLPPQLTESRWTKENRIVLKQLMASLPPHDIGAALRVILDTFGVESSKLVRRGEFVELDLQHINDDYILDSLWNYCAQMQFNIQQIQQPVYYQQQQQIPVQQPMFQQMYTPQSNPQQMYAQFQPPQQIPNNDPSQQYMHINVNQNHINNQIQLGPHM